MVTIDIQNIRNVIVKEIYKHTGLTTVDTDNPNKKPAYPFYSYKMTALYMPYNYYGIRSKENLVDTIKETTVLQPKITISFNCYSNDIVEVSEKILKSWEWFKFVGYLPLKDNNIIVVDVMPIQDRTSFLTTDYEYRQGFDVVLRTTHVIDREIETIEEFNFKEREE